MNYRNNNKRYLLGYSFIELMIVIMTMTLLFSFGMASYRSFQRRQSLKAAVRQVRADLALVREFAVAGKLKPLACGATDLDAYRFSIDTTNDDYTIEAVCDDGNIIADIDKNDIKVAPGFDISKFSVEPYLEFNVLGKGANARTRFVIASQTDTSLTADIWVEESGQIN